MSREAILDAARTTGGIVTVEEHSIYGGLGGAVAGNPCRAGTSRRMKILGIPWHVFAPLVQLNFCWSTSALPLMESGRRRSIFSGIPPKN